MCVDEQEEKEQFSSSTCSKARKGEFRSSFDRESEDLTICSQGSSSTDQEPVHRPHRPLPFCHLCRTPPDPAGQ